MNHKFLLVDINSYFATLAQQENPYLRGKPVAIVKNLGRTCVIAASKEAKKLGIKTGTNVALAKRLAPDLIEVEANFDMYLSATNKLKNLFYSLSPSVYVYSLDEAFIDVSRCTKHLYSDLHQLGRSIQLKIKEQLGEWVTANVGIGENRLLAKMAAEISEKGSVFEINSQNKDAILAEVSFGDVCGIGLRLTKKLTKMGIFCPYQIRFYSLSDLELYFGPFWAKELQKIAYGEEPHHFKLLDNEKFTSARTKSISRSVTAWDLVKTLSEIRRIVLNLTREVVYKSRRMGLSGRRVSLFLVGSEGLNWNYAQTFKDYLSHTYDVFSIFDEWLNKKWQQQFSPIKFGVVLSMLSSSDSLTQSFLPSWQKLEKVESALDDIDNKYGLYFVRPASLYKECKLIKPEVAGFLGDKEYQFNYR
ncbi:MAG: DNA-directed DNA polymerase [Microgenomates bacterium 39_7]|nr:MAG: DNA-directed DNA polymerase [Microgenomates bacterium 39_7]